MREKLFPRTVAVAAGCLLASSSAAVPSASSTEQGPADAPRAAGDTSRVSVSTLGQQGDDISGRAARPAVSFDGSVIAFDSIATTLVRRDTNGLDDVFVSDGGAGTTTRVSVSATGGQGNGDSTRPDVSGSGRFVVFESAASNLVPGDDDHAPDVFLRDRTSRTTSLVSVARSGGGANGPSGSPAISRDGRYVAFVSEATDLVRPSATGVFLRDLRTGRTEVVSVESDGTPALAGGGSPSVSAHGRFVAFSSFSSTLVARDTNDLVDVFVRDRRRLRTTRVSVDTDGRQAVDASSSLPAISADGSSIAFVSASSTLVAGDANGAQDVFVHDRVGGATSLVSVASDGSQADDQSNGPGLRGGSTFGPDVSADGRFVVFDSIATDLVPGDTNTCDFPGPPAGPTFLVPGQCPDVFVRDTLRGTTHRTSVRSGGGQANGASTDPAISGDSRTVAFFTTASNLAGGDTNTCRPFFEARPGQCPDIYRHRR